MVRALQAGICLLVVFGTFEVTSAQIQYSDSILVRQLDAEYAQLQERLSQPLSLDDCIEIALARNIPLEIARHEREIVDRGVDAAYGDWLPTLVFQTRRTRLSTDADSTLGLFLGTTTTAVEAGVAQRLPMGGAVTFGYTFDQISGAPSSGFGGSVTLVQPLLRDAGWGKATAEISDATLAAGAEEATLRSRLLGVVFNVKSAYYEVLRLQKLVEVAEGAITRDERLLAFSNAKVEAKLATRRDVLSAEIILEQDRGKLVNAQTGHRAAIDALADVLGVRVLQPIDVVYIDIQPTTVETQDDAWVQKALRDNPDVQRARTSLERDALANRVAGNDRLPQLDLQLRYENIQDAVLLGDADRRGARAWEGMVTVSYPFLNRPLESAHRQAQLRYEQSRRLLLEIERQVVFQVRDAIRNIKRSEDRIEVVQKTIEGSRDKVEFANVNFQLGRASNLDITDAQKDLTEAEADLVEEITSHRVELARLERLLGGSLQD